MQDVAPENSIVELLFSACWDNLGLVLFKLIQREDLPPYRTAAPVPACHKTSFCCDQICVKVAPSVLKGKL